MPTAFPGHGRAGHRRSVWSNDDASPSFLHIRPQYRVLRKLRLLWTARGSLGVPLRCGRTICQTAASGGGVRRNSREIVDAARPSRRATSCIEEPCTRRSACRSRHSNIRGLRRGQIIDGVSIANRAPEIEDRAIPGHWEGDLIAGRGNTHIATLVERHSRFTMLVKVSGKDTNTVVRALSTQVRTLPDQLRQSLTWDRGMELADHKTFTLATDTQVYVCDPRSPWQRGTNENTNKLLRQYFPRGTDLSLHSQPELNRVAHRLNQRPRTILGYETPADRLLASVASTD